MGQSSLIVTSREEKPWHDEAACEVATWNLNTLDSESEIFCLLLPLCIAMELEMILSNA